MLKPIPKKAQIAVAGGSIAGLSAGAALFSAGFDVHIFERSAQRLSSRGAGLVVQPELLELIATIEAEPLAMTTCAVRRTIDASTGRSDVINMPQQFTSWEAVHASLRSAFPDERYHLGCELIIKSQFAHGVKIDANGEITDAGLLIAADGIRSRFRMRLAPDAASRYAGYIAWRGVVDEARLEASLIDYFDDAFSFCQTAEGGHALCYFIPGADRALERGARRLNWVWYVVVEEGPALDGLMTDKSGRRRNASVPQGEIGAAARQSLLARAGELTAPFAELVRATPDPFIQSIIDVAPPGMTFGRVCLIGDAAFVVRPHTAAAAAKAASDAMALAQALRNADGDFGQGLAAWDRQQTALGRRLLEYGVMLGERSRYQRGV